MSGISEWGGKTYVVIYGAVGNPEEILLSVSDPNITITGADYAARNTI